MIHRAKGRDARAAFPIVAIALGSNLSRSDSAKLPLVLAQICIIFQLFHVAPFINRSVMALAKSRVRSQGRAVGKPLGR